MVTVSKEWVKQQAAKATYPVVEGWKDGALSIFIAGRPRHFKGSTHVNAKIGHTKRLRERTANRLFPWQRMVSVVRGMTIPPWPWTPAQPKRVTFTVYWRSSFDGDDNLRLVCSAAKDALKDCGLVDDDRDSSGHVFLYEQAKPTRKAGAVHGICVRVELL